MRDNTIKAFRKLADLTLEKCKTCKDPDLDQYRCCDKMFCNIVDAELKKKGIKIEHTGHELPFMGPMGCVVAPENRPYCTGFVCAPHMQDKKFRKKYERIVGDIENDTEFPKMPRPI